MIVKDVKLTLLKIRHKEGTGKTSGKPYSFYTADVVDDDANVFGFNLDDKLAPKDAIETSELLAVKNAPIIATVRFTPKGFDVSGTILDFDPAKG